MNPISMLCAQLRNFRTPRGGLVVRVDVDATVVELLCNALRTADRCAAIRTGLELFDWASPCSNARLVSCDQGGTGVKVFHQPQLGFEASGTGASEAPKFNSVRRCAIGFETNEYYWFTIQRKLPRPLSPASLLEQCMGLALWCHGEQELDRKVIVTTATYQPLWETYPNLDIAAQAHRRDTRCWKHDPSGSRVLPVLEPALIRKPLASDNVVQRLPKVCRDGPPPLVLTTHSIPCR